MLDIGAEIPMLVAALDGGDHLIAHHEQPPVAPGAIGDKALKERWLCVDAMQDIARLRLILRQVDLLTKGAAALLDHHGPAQRCAHALQKIHIAVAQPRKGLRAQHGIGLAHARALQGQIGQRLVIAQRDGLCTVEHRQSHRFQARGQADILVIEQHKVHLQAGTWRHEHKIRVHARDQADTRPLRRLFKQLTHTCKAALPHKCVGNQYAFHGCITPRHFSCLWILASCP